MECSPQFNFGDVLWAPAHALSAKQILSMTLFLLVALGVYDLLSYMAYWVDGQSVRSVFGLYGFFPFSNLPTGSFSSAIVWGVGVALAVLSIMFGFFSVAAINVESVRGNRFLTARQSIGFTVKRMRQVFLSEFAIVLFLAFVVLLFVILGLVTRIPIVGEWLFAILLVIPNFIIAILSVFIVFVFSLSFLVLPAVAAAERNGETFAAILDTFSTIIRQPVRWLGYTTYSLVAAKVAGFLFAYFSYRAVQFMTWASALGGGTHLKQLVLSGLSHLPVRSDIVSQTFNVFPGISFGIDFASYSQPHADSAVSYVVAFMLFLIFASIIGYMFAVIASAQARTYVAIRFLKDGYRIDEEDPLFFEETSLTANIDSYDFDDPYPGAGESAE